MGPAKPTSRLQGYIQDIFEGLNELANAKQVTMVDDGRGNIDVVNLPSQDFFDKWYENSGIAEYTQAYKLMLQLNSMASAAGVSAHAGYGEDSFQDILRDLAAKVAEEPEVVYIIGESINTHYPGLAALPIRGSAEGYNESEIDAYNDQVNTLRLQIEENVDTFTEELQLIEEAEKTEFESIAEQLNKIVIFGVANWLLMLYSVMSPYAPRVLINGLLHRANAHTMLAGDISTAKSQILQILYRIAPKILPVDETTKASLEGVAKAGADTISDGVLDMANDGNIAVEEFTKKFAGMPLFRRAMDCKNITIYKGGMDKTIDVNTSMIVACNPDQDFFQEETTFRSQLSFKEGILSRFDILIPLMNLPVKNEIILEKMKLFGTDNRSVDFERIHRGLKTLQVGMVTLKGVIVNEEQQETLKAAYRHQNDKDKRLQGGALKNRPLVILRDMETLARFVNVIASVNFSKREKQEGYIIIKDEDVENAIQLWENLMHLRLSLYAENSSRNMPTVAEEIQAYIAWKDRGNGGVPMDELKRQFVEVKQVVSEKTFYREIKSLQSEGKVVKTAKYGGNVKLVVK